MFVVKDYTNYSVDYYFCRTIEKAKEIFDRIFWECPVPCRKFRPVPLFP